MASRCDSFAGSFSAVTRHTCQVDQRPGGGTYTLSLVPQSNAAAGIAETFNTAWSAFRRHAMIASELRRSGWTLAAYSAD
jgi:hypothetical protein